MRKYKKTYAPEVIDGFYIVRVAKNSTTGYRINLPNSVCEGLGLESGNLLGMKKIKDEVVIKKAALKF